MDNVTISLPTKYGPFSLVEFGEQIALLKGNVLEKDNVLVRIHSSCFTSEVLGSLRCDCNDQLEYAMAMIHEEGAGMIIYLSQEGRGIGLHNKLKAYSLQDQGMDTVEANEALGFENDLRTYDDAVTVLHKYGITSVRLMTNNPAKVKALEEKGLSVERVPCIIKKNKYNTKYLETKKVKMLHHL
ncbi:TPA: GTP cyclohydrolase II [Candidatus Woesearchaeota archaeon]|nr:GTP cyclohydrolase II [archaeon]HIJ11018.1 GTP cyclohydrolase II [Candidatus Woesearchaeota archaeon]